MIAFVQEDRERRDRALARTLHDDIGSLLVAAAMDLAALPPTNPESPRLSRARDFLQRAIDLKRTLSESLRPSLLDNFGLFAACRWHNRLLCERAEIFYRDNYPSDEMALSAAALIGLFRINQEAMAMITAEPSVATIEVAVEMRDAHLSLSLSHEHAGSETHDLSMESPLQLLATIARTHSLHGTWDVLRRDSGSTLTMTFPLAQLIGVARP